MRTPVRPIVASAITTVCVCVMALAGSAPAGATPNRSDGHLVLAQLGPETGPYQALLEGLRRPVQLAVDEINAAGGVNGTPVKLVTGDEGTEDPAITAATFDRVVASDLADAIIGPAFSPTAVRILAKAKNQDVVICSGSNAASQLSTLAPKESGGRYFRTVAPDALQGPAVAELVLADGHSSVGILSSRGADDVIAATKDALSKGGAKIVANRTYASTSSDLTSAVKNLAAKKLDAVIVLTSTDDAAKVVATMIANGIGPAQIPIYGTSSLQAQRFGAAVDPANPGVVAGLKGVTPAGAPSNVDSPFPAALAATGIEPFFSAHSYDCTIMVALAATAARSSDSSEIAAAFTSILRGKNDCNTFAGCKDLLKSGKTIHWNGASSNFNKFPRNEPKDGVFDVWTYDAAGNPQTESATSQIYIT